MKKSLLALIGIALVAAVSFAAQAAGYDVASLVTPEMAIGLSALGAAGMITYIKEGETLTLTPGADVAKGVGYLFGSAIFGVAQNTVANGVAGEFLTEGVVTIGKTSALAISVGDRLFWDATNKVVNKTTTAQQCIGVAVEAAANPSSTVVMKIGQYVPVAT